MVQEPRLLLLDEPAAHLDIGAREQIIQTLVRLRGQTGITTVLVCHELESIPPGCQRVVLLESGRAVADGRPVDVLTSDRVEALYGIRAEVLQHHDRLALVPTGAGT
jgi:iron complex transport system ATP-binding protein